MPKRFENTPDFVEQALEFWAILPKTNGIPGKKEFHPLAGLPKSMITQIGLATIKRDPLDAEITLCGSRLQQQIGKPVVGRSIYDIHDHDEAFARYWLSHVEIMVRDRKPVYSEGTFNGEFSGTKQVRRYFFPFSIDHPGQVDGFAYINWIYFGDRYEQDEPITIETKEADHTEPQPLNL